VNLGVPTAVERRKHHRHRLRHRRRTENDRV